MVIIKKTYPHNLLDDDFIYMHMINMMRHNNARQTRDHSLVIEISFSLKIKSQRISSFKEAKGHEHELL